MSLKSLVAFTKTTLPIEILVVNVENSISESKRRNLIDMAGKLVIKFVETSENNLALSRNLGITHAAYDTLLFLDADTEIESNAVSRLLGTMESLLLLNSRLAGVGGINFPPKSESLIFRLQYLFQRCFWGHLYSPQMWIPNEVTPVRHLSTVFALYRKEILKKLGGFNPAFAMVCEDVDLGFRLSEQKCALYLDPKAHVIHRSESTLQGWLKRSFRFGLGQILVLEKHPSSFAGSKAIALMAPLFLIGFLLWAPDKLFILTLIYVPMLWVEISRLSLKEKFTPTVFLDLLLFSFLTHTSYVLGIFGGLLNYFLKFFRKEPELATEQIA